MEVLKADSKRPDREWERVYDPRHDEPEDSTPSHAPVGVFVVLAPATASRFVPNVNTSTIRDTWGDRNCGTPRRSALRNFSDA